MVPIFEQGDGRGIGLTLEGFSERFDQICAEHLKAKRAASFALIFYDFRDRSFRQVIDDLGVFAELDRLTGKKMSLFYLHTSSRKGTEAFNDRFLARLGVEGTTLPCVAFFKFRKNEMQDLEVVCLDQANLIHGFNELYGVVEERVDQTPRLKMGKSALKWATNGGKAVAFEIFRLAIREGLSSVVNRP